MDLETKTSMFMIICIVPVILTSNADMSLTKLVMFLCW